MLGVNHKLYSMVFPFGTTVNSNQQHQRIVTNIKCSVRLLLGYSQQWGFS